MTLVICMQRTGGPEVLQPSHVDLAPPGPGQVLVRHTAIGVNFIDTYHRTGLYPVKRLPSGLGVEAAGVIEAISADVTEFRLGDRVAYASGPPGAYSERRVIEASELVSIPDEVSDEFAAAALLKGMTVEYLVRRTHAVARGEAVLWHAAAGGVGLLACQWLAHLGAFSIGTVSSDQKAKLSLDYGLSRAIVYTRDSFVERARELTNNRGVAVAYDSVGRATFEGSLSCLAPRGLLVSFGNASGKPPPLDLLQLSRKGSLYVTRPTLADYTATPQERRESAAAVFDLMRKGALRAVIGQRFGLREAARAHRALEARETVGSSLLIP